MPTQQAGIQDQAILRQANGKTRSVTVLAITPQKDPPTGLAAVPSASGGTLGPGTVGYRVSAVVGGVETQACAEVTAVVPGGGTGSVVLTWNAVAGATSYNIYGRTVGAETQQKTGVGAATYTDTAADTPGATPLPKFGGAKATVDPRHTKYAPQTNITVMTTATRKGSTPSYYRRFGQSAAAPRVVRL
jgi:hypothetical protein